jgi:16S rRNA G966 N2-methylase RsmD
VFVESSERSLGILRSNIESTGFGPRSEVLKGDGLVLPRLDPEGGMRFAIAFLDPPFPGFDEESSRTKIFRRVAELLARGLLPGGRVVLRAPSRHEGTFPMEPTTTRRYGESLVSFFDAPPRPEEGRAGS